MDGREKGKCCITHMGKPRNINKMRLKVTRLTALNVSLGWDRGSEINTQNGETSRHLQITMTWNSGMGGTRLMSGLGHSIFTRSLLLKIFSIRLSVCVLGLGVECSASVV